jgi:uncharacterized surface protein with fasciclin (FAS1) repeats
MADLFETTRQADSFKTLVSAIEVAGLIPTLQSSDVLTVLAPTDDAFAKLPAGTLDALLQDIPKLQKLLSYHVLYGDVRAEDLAQIDEAPTVEGSVVAVEQTDGSVKINEATVLTTDILADNGVIHAIDTVLMPAIMAGHS